MNFTGKKREAFLTNVITKSPGPADSVNSWSKRDKTSGVSTAPRKAVGSGQRLTAPAATEECPGDCNKKLRVQASSAERGHNSFKVILM